MELSELKTLPIIDEEQINMLVEAGEDGAAELIEELLDLFQTEAAPQLEAIRSAHATRDYARAARPAHAVAGSSANLGGLRLSRLAKALELTAESGEAERFEALAPAVDALYHETVDAFAGQITRLREG
jgi:HPt (histidine-containing phosphotransfer) domain-containing protein